ISEHRHRTSYGKLFCHEDLKATTPLLEALQDFIAFLSSFRRPVLLVGHNARSFDAPILSRVLTQSSLLEPFREAVSGTLDTLPVSRELFPDLQNHRQEFLVRRFLNKQYGAHNAVEDAKVLQELFKHWDIQDQTVWEKRKTDDKSKRRYTNGNKRAQKTDLRSPHPSMFEQN
uniref:exodeoxyribonuclease III n=1 Tax=Salarias fasciatus TaxID=181472 RepID=A0A672HXX0_SALFA